MKKAYLKRSFLLFGAVLLFTFFDWILHQSDPLLSVPSWYFQNKIIFGTLWACLTGFFVQKYTIKIQAAIITLVTVSLLQIRYILYGYTWEFHAIIFPAHLIFLYGTTYGLLYLSQHWEIRGGKKK